MAHAFLQSFSHEIDVFSAGTKPVEKIDPLAVKVMKEDGIDISGHRPHSVMEYLNDTWDYVITVCGEANESCHVFVDNVNHRLHIGFDATSDAIGSDEFIMTEFRRVRDEIKNRFEHFYNDNLK